MRLLDKQNLGKDEDWFGNNAAVTCFACGKVFISSQVLHRRGRACPVCGKCKVTVTKQQVTVTGPDDLN